jgi:hypothetical protein
VAVLRGMSTKDVLQELLNQYTDVKQQFHCLYLYSQVSYLYAIIVYLYAIVNCVYS